MISRQLVTVFGTGALALVSGQSLAEETFKVAYIDPLSGPGATVGEVGFLRAIWMDGAKRLAWLEDYASSLVAAAALLLLKAVVAAVPHARRLGELLPAKP